MKISPHEQAFILYKKYGGRSLTLIEREMRELGYTKFSRRSFYANMRNGKRRPGWIERFGWEKRVSSPHVSKGSTERGFSNAEFGIKTSAAVTSGPDTASANIPHSAFRPPHSFPAWLRATAANMQWDARHQQIVYEHLQRVTSGETKRLMIFMPPRHGKSELVTIRYAAWRLRQNPKMRVVIGSYSQHLANKFSRSIRRVLADEEDEQMRNAEREMRNEVKGGNPETAGNAGTLACMSPQGERQQTANGQSPTEGGDLKIRHSSFRTPHSRMFPRSRNINTMAEWETAVGGGVKAVGVGAGITGFGAELMIIDDPVKSRAQAESKVYRERVWDWFRDDICTRLEPGAPMILIQTRWHEDDLAGRILNEMNAGGEHWDVLSLPAIADAKGERIKDEGESEECEMNTEGGNPTCREGVDECGNSNAELGIDTADSQLPTADDSSSSGLHPSSLIPHPSSFLPFFRRSSRPRRCPLAGAFPGGRPARTQAPHRFIFLRLALPANAFAGRGRYFEAGLVCEDRRYAAADRALGTRLRPCDLHADDRRLHRKFFGRC